MNICLCKMTKDYMHSFFKEFQSDPDIYAHNWQCAKYVYDPMDVDAYFEKQIAQEKQHFAVMLDDVIIGDVYLKQIDSVNKQCGIGIHMKNDAYKNKGYGTQATILLLYYAFRELKMECVYADTMRHNNRSQHMLMKSGFYEIDRDDNRIYYKCKLESWYECSNRIFADTKCSIESTTI